jgi:Protein of unknown function (DUF1045)
MSSARYAIYLAPPPDTPLWMFGSRVLGYDAATGEDVESLAPEGFSPEQWLRLTERPRTYGFHATLKAPFRLEVGRSEDELIADLDAFGRNRPGFDLGPLWVEALSGSGDTGFAALIQKRPSPELVALEHDVVRAFDSFRAPSSIDELKKRKPETLTDRQRESLLQFGYPFVGPDFRFHMTLSGEIADVAHVADGLADAMANEIGTAHLHVEALVLFAQESADRRFRAIHRSALADVIERASTPSAIAGAS